MKKRIVLIDGQTSFREMLVCVLARSTACEIVGQAGTGLDAIKVCEREHPDVAVLDLMLPELCGVEVIRRLMAEQPGIRVLVFTSTVNQHLLIDAMKCRPHGFVEKSDTLETFLEALSAVCSGARFLTPFASTLFYDSLSTPEEQEFHLSKRESEILQLVAEGRSSKEISSLLGVALKTVENHRAHLMTKLQIHDVASLTRYAMKLGIVSSG